MGAPETLKLLAFSMEKEKLENALHHTIEKKKLQKVNKSLRVLENQHICLCNIVSTPLSSPRFLRYNKQTAPSLVIFLIIDYSTIILLLSTPSVYYTFMTSAKPILRADRSVLMLSKKLSESRARHDSAILRHEPGLGHLNLPEAALSGRIGHPRLSPT